MENERIRAMVLLCSGMVGIASPSLPWSGGLSLLQLLAVNEVTTAFPETSLSMAVSDSQLAAVYVTVYVGLVASSFLLLLGLLQFQRSDADYRGFRLLSISLLVGAALSATHYPVYPPQFGLSSSGFYVFVSLPVVLLLSEWSFTAERPVVGLSE